MAHQGTAVGRSGRSFGAGWSGRSLGASIFNEATIFCCCREQVTMAEGARGSDRFQVKRVDHSDIDGEDVNYDSDVIEVSTFIGFLFSFSSSR